VRTSDSANQSQSPDVSLHLAAKVTAARCDRGASLHATTSPEEWQTRFYLEELADAAVSVICGLSPESTSQPSAAGIHRPVPGVVCGGRLAMAG
jgi:hypothetical protein